MLFLRWLPFAYVGPSVPFFKKQAKTASQREGEKDRELVSPPVSGAGTTLHRCLNTQPTTAMAKGQAPGGGDPGITVAALPITGLAADEGEGSSSGASSSKKDPRTIARGYAICSFLFGFFVVRGFSGSVIGC